MNSRNRTRRPATASLPTHTEAQTDRRVIVNPNLARVAATARARVIERVRHHLLRTYQRLIPAPAAMMEVIVDAWVAQAVAAAAALGVALSLIHI